MNGKVNEAMWKLGVGRVQRGDDIPNCAVIYGDYSPNEQHERAAWTYSKLRMLLVQSGQIRKALRGRYYLKEHNARLAKARSDREYFRWFRLWISKWIIRLSEESKILDNRVLSEPQPSFLHSSTSSSAV